MFALPILMGVLVVWQRQKTRCNVSNELAMEAASIIPRISATNLALGERLFLLEQMMAGYQARTSMAAVFQLGIVATQIDTVLANLPEESRAFLPCQDAVVDAHRMLFSVATLIYRGSEQERIFVDHYFSRDLLPPD